MIVVIDYGVGNLKSVKNMLLKVGAEVTISGDPEVIKAADKLILPGVGKFDHGMKMLKESGLIETLNQLVLKDGKVVLGICLGAQILGKGSEEGKLPGLGWIDMHCKRFPKSDEFKVPHMMWNEAVQVSPCALLDDRDEDSRYYFVHSYYMNVTNQEDIVATTSYDSNFVSAVQTKNIIGMQFHPEKSLKFGMAIMKKFNELTPEELCK